MSDERDFSAVAAPAAGRPARGVSLPGRIVVAPSVPRAPVRVAVPFDPFALPAEDRS